MMLFLQGVIVYNILILRELSRMTNTACLAAQTCRSAAEKDLEVSFLTRGWVHRRRDHGGLIFIDLRDRSGLLQCVFHPEQKNLFEEAEHLRPEWVLELTGRIQSRPKGTENPSLKTGSIELVITKMRVLNKAKTLPFSIEEHGDVSHEELRLRYRYLDLRRPAMLAVMEKRAAVFRFIRAFLDQRDFLEIETPFLTKATPEGARDYLVPSRTHAKSFFALPQSPQLFKQLLMVGGIERYYQIVRCFRDEDLRADRQPEFTQLDLETSFLNQDQILKLMEDLFCGLFKTHLAVDLPSSFERMPYQEAMNRFGSDKPDRRIALELVDVGDLFTDRPFAAFQSAARDDKSRVAVLRVPGGGDLSRKQIDDYTQYVAQYGAKGLAYIKIHDAEKGIEGAQSPILKFMTEEIVTVLYERVGAMSGDLLFFGADTIKIVNASLGALRVKVAQDRGLVSEGWAPLWVTDFPLLEWEDKEKRWVACHHPFTAPQDPALLEENPGQCLAQAYDLVLNGVEVGGGSLRIHDMALQLQIFKYLGLPEHEAQEKFGFLLEALQYGCPPHGGIALGLDRLLMMMIGATSIRDVIAFPKTQSAACLLTGAPARIEVQTLKDLGLQHGRT
jgi:aspartyl-tRNA synthetase